MEREDNLLRNVYGKALFPNMIAILGGTINVFVDGILIGQCMGEIGIAAVNQSLAVYLLLCTIGSLFAAGASAESAHAFGQREMEKGQEYFSLALELALVIGILLCGLGVLLTPKIAALLGSPETVSLIEQYIRITFFGGVFKILLYIPYFYLRLEGKMRQSAIAMLTMTVLNIGLDYIFLFRLQMGISGAAWASVLATVVACTLSFWFLWGKDTQFRFHPIGITGEKVKRIFTSGSPMAANNLFSALRIIALNSIMNLVSGSSMVAIFAITNNLNEFSICVQNGVPQTGSALLGVYHGESDTEAIRKLLWLQFQAGLLLAALMMAGTILFSGQIGYLFGCELDVRFAVSCWAVSLLLGICNNIMSYYYYAVRNAAMANLITVLRVFFVTVAVAFCMVPLGERIWLFYPAAELISALIWMGYGVFLAKKQGQKSLLLLEENTGASMQLSVGCDAEEICGVSAGVSEFCEENGLNLQQSMTLSLALEELMMITAEKTLKNQGRMDVRILRIKDGALLRIRSEGIPYNPLEHEADNLDFMGVQMIMNMAIRTEYQSTLGLNTLIVEI